MARRQKRTYDYWISDLPTNSPATITYERNEVLPESRPRTWADRIDQRRRPIAPRGGHGCETTNWLAPPSDRQKVALAHDRETPDVTVVGPAQPVPS
jgi:hypothetical protein